uniref:MADF domain-containing protein n=1 Tax=Glossina brevipalpis TaxID=37001 RepID=A0A1A9X5R9_9MUSC
MFEEKLINAVAKREEIYNKHLLGYRNRLIKEKNWHVISKEVGRSVDECKGRWRTLRDRFLREFNKKTGGVTSSGNLKWKFYDRLEFLSDHLSPKVTETSLYLESPIEIPETPIEEISETNHAPFRKSGEDKFLDAVTKLSGFVEQKLEREERDDGFEKFLGSMLRKVDPQLRDGLKIDILNFANRRINEINSTTFGI